MFKSDAPLLYKLTYQSMGINIDFSLGGNSRSLPNCVCVGQEYHMTSWHAVLLAFVLSFHHPHCTRVVVAVFLRRILPPPGFIIGVPSIIAPSSTTATTTRPHKVHSPISSRSSGPYAS